MKKNIVIVGSGITGILTAYVITQLKDSVNIHLIDAGPDPLVEYSREKNNHYGTTLGKSRGVRHLTGTEGLSFQNPIHTELIRKPAAKDRTGWQAIPNNELTIREELWRNELELSYSKLVPPGQNPFDQIYTTLNYAGMLGWKLLKTWAKTFNANIQHENIGVVLSTSEELRYEYASETFYNLDSENSIELKNLSSYHEKASTIFKLENISNQILQVPGSTIDVKKVWSDLYAHLRSKKEVKFSWDSQIINQQDLPDADSYIWTAGVGYATPDIYRASSKVQGVGGCWATINNPGITSPFKFSAPQPSGFLNFTPENNFLHISGGFGWTGERTFPESELLLNSVKTNFLKSIQKILNLSESELTNTAIDFCLRPTTPTGLPDVKWVGNNLMLSGAGKAGTTQAPILALYAAAEIGLGTELQSLTMQANKQQKALIKDAFTLLDS